MLSLTNTSNNNEMKGVGLRENFLDGVRDLLDGAHHIHILHPRPVGRPNLVLGSVNNRLKIFKGIVSRDEYFF
jgi:hypothetical protein